MIVRVQEFPGAAEIEKTECYLDPDDGVIVFQTVSANEWVQADTVENLEDWR